MNKTILKTVIITATAITLLSACKPDETEQKALTADEKIITTTDSARVLLIKARNMDDDRLSHQKAAATPAGSVEDDADNMSAIRFDGSSEDAFNQGLDEFQSLATAAEYNKLTNALKYLLVYDFSSRGNKARLYANLDGLTPAEISARALEIGR